MIVTAEAEAKVSKLFSFERIILLKVFFYWGNLLDRCKRDGKTKEGLKKIKPIPNRISWFRIIFSIPLAITLYAIFISAYTDQIDIWLFTLLIFIWIYIYGFLTYGDRIDGLIARDYDAKTILGALLDPGADKTSFVSAVVPIGLILGLILNDQQYIVLASKFWLLMIAEMSLVLLALLGGVINRFVKKSIKLGANIFGKLKYPVEIIGFVLVFLLIVASFVTDNDYSQLIYKTAYYSLSLAIVLAFLSIFVHIKLLFTSEQ
ncbi:hypothetical protein COS74_00610 [bacterium CG06_land_8_20_14_3_00_33_50]|nr:MAG: hypothetical protein AUJ93_02630 [bacterium CG2_30_33_46]PIU77090.1 MAG: hypothetical protein COS74_00610 [bacterium CG06_land_8_20_14_3_00_33_50]PIW81187.1 MAG: hypothetical protein COZ97_03070 [bacterium CG_4_8_14_3_um_filter_33_28]PIY85042.1 MAG: hypothetical protein COY76_04230 [bacterium CG_4_10_14_0_8_um_filter_33_57]PJA71956.1 MAG: hypothetical protein CO152_03925 [bacterium CG_4_9_14_3_um_filter_33_26]